LAREEIVRRLHDALDETNQAAVQEALKDRRGRLDPGRFEAKYGRGPTRGVRASAHRPGTAHAPGIGDPEGLAADPVEARARAAPAGHLRRRGTARGRAESLEGLDDRQGHDLRYHAAPPAAHRGGGLARADDLAPPGRDGQAEGQREDAETDRAHRADDRTPPCSCAAISYEAEDRSEYEHEPGWDLTIRAFAWPCILQAAGFASVAGGKLGLSPAGRKALTRPAHEVLHTAWQKWLETNLFDEFERIDAIQGKKSARLTAAANRRTAVNDVLAQLPPSLWVAVDEFFRVLLTVGARFDVARDVWKMYITDQYYGSFRYGGDWSMIQGRFILAFLSECAATLGLIDVAYIAPQGALDDYTHHGSTDDLDCLSRYDGLKDLRINTLEA